MRGYRELITCLSGTSQFAPHVGDYRSFEDFFASFLIFTPHSGDEYLHTATDNTHPDPGGYFFVSMKNRADYESGIPPYAHIMRVIILMNTNEGGLS